MVECGLSRSKEDNRYDDRHSRINDRPVFQSAIRNPKSAITMLRSKLIHPKILEVLGRAGHHAKVLIADGNYPASSARGPHAELVSLNLMPGVPLVNQVLEAVLSAVPIEAANTMDYERTGQYALTEDPPVWADYAKTIRAAGVGVTLEPIEKWAFYKAVGTADHVLTIQTADQQRFANLLLTIGVRMDSDERTSRAVFSPEGAADA
jgi:L-fucose mutarotase